MDARQRTHHAGRFTLCAIPLLAAVLVAGCGLIDRPAGKDSGIDTSPDASAPAEVETASASGPLAAACPSLSDAKAAVPAITTGPDINTTPFKTMVLQCVYELSGIDLTLRQAGIGILVFETSEQGVGIWDSVRTDPAFPNPIDLPALEDVAQVAFATGAAGHNDVWVVQGPYAIHMSSNGRDGVPLDQMSVLARLTLAGLAKAGG